MVKLRLFRASSKTDIDTINRETCRIVFEYESNFVLFQKIRPKHAYE